MIQALARIVLLGLMAATLSNANAQPQESDQQGLYIALGDSVAAGIGSSLPRTRSYPAILHNWMAALSETAVPFVNLARPGETTASFLSDGQFGAFQREVALSRDAQLPISLVTVTLGGNELLGLQNTGVSERQSALDGFTRTYGNALQMIRSEIGPEPALIVTTYYDVTDGNRELRFTDSWWIAQYNAAISEGAAAANARVADITSLFRSHIGEYTRYPIDPHPTNRAHLAIAQHIWSELRFDTVAPVVEVLSAESVKRRTPTMRWRIIEMLELGSISVRVSNGSATKAFAQPDDQYVALIDLRGIDSDRVTVTIETIDLAGNTTVVDTVLTLSSLPDSANGGTS